MNKSWADTFNKGRLCMRVTVIQFIQNARRKITRYNNATKILSIKRWIYYDCTKFGQCGKNRIYVHTNMKKRNFKLWPINLCACSVIYNVIIVHVIYIKNCCLSWAQILYIFMKICDDKLLWYYRGKVLYLPQTGKLQMNFENCENK